MSKNTILFFFAEKKTLCKLSNHSHSIKIVEMLRHIAKLNGYLTINGCFQHPISMFVVGMSCRMSRDVLH